MGNRLTINAMPTHFERLTVEQHDQLIDSDYWIRETAAPNLLSQRRNDSQLGDDAQHQIDEFQVVRSEGEIDRAASPPVDGPDLVHVLKRCRLPPRRPSGW